MEKDKKIVRFISLHIPYSCCNLRCSYCYVRQFGDFNNRPISLPNQEIIKNAFSKRRVGGIALFNFCAKGETLFHPDIVRIICDIVDCGHYVSVVTNGTYSDAFDSFIKHNIPFDKTFFKFSFHYKELCAKGLLNRFIENVHKVRDRGASYTIELVGSDDNIPYIDEIKEVSLNAFGALPHVTIPRDDRKPEIDLMTNYSLEEYKTIWSAFDSELFRFKIRILYEKRVEYCMAGNYSLQIDLSNGDIMQCVGHPKIGNAFVDLDSPLPLRQVGTCCCLPYCYNGHVYLTLGDIKEYDAPTYLAVRNRKMLDGGEWFTREMKDIFSQKLYENNM